MAAPRLKLQAGEATPRFYMGAEGLNVDLHACTASTLPTETAPFCFAFETEF